MLRLKKRVIEPFETKLLYLTIIFTIRPTSDTAVTLKTGRREVPGPNRGRACRPSRSVDWLVVG